MKSILLTSVLGIGLLAGCTPNSVENASKQFNELPPAVQATVRSKAPDAEVANIKKDTRNGVNVYVIDSGIWTPHTDFGGRASGVFTAINDGKLLAHPSRE